MLIAGQKSKHVHKTLGEKAQALKGIEIGLPNKEVAGKYNVLKNTLSIWVKNKDKVLPSLEEGQIVKRQKLRAAAHEALDQAVLKWLLNIRSQNILLSVAIIQG